MLSDLWNDKGETRHLVTWAAIWHSRMLHDDVNIRRRLLGLDHKGQGTVARPHQWHTALITGLLALPLCLSCSPDPPFTKNLGTSTANRSPSIRSAMLKPSPLTLASPVYVQVDAEDPEGDEITFGYRWLVNGVIIPEAKTQTLSPDFLKRGDALSVEISASDGHTDPSLFLTDPVVVVNAQPIVNHVSLEVERSSGKARLTAKVEAKDPDGDEIQYSYRWWRNDQLVKDGTESFLANIQLIRNDVFTVEAKAYDQEAQGVTVKSLPLVIGNTSPEITSQPVSPFNRPLYSYKILARDADGDPLSYALDIAPPGMMIDKGSGEIRWDIPAELSGTHRVKVVVEDGRGGSNSQEFELSIPSSAS